jgi:transposase
MLFPAHLKEFIEENDLCRVIDDVVNTLDLSCLCRKVSSEGNMAYHPKMMLKVLFYAYASGIFSSRKIAKALGENVAFIFLAAWQRPDFRTISYFRKNNLEAIRDLFGQIVLLCQKLNMVKLGHISIDGSKFKANAADRRSYDQKRTDNWNLTRSMPTSPTPNIKAATGATLSIPLTKTTSPTIRPRICSSARRATL